MNKGLIFRLIILRSYFVAKGITNAVYLIDETIEELEK